MPVPSSINDLSPIAGSNSPAGSESPALLDDYLRAQASFIAQLRDGAAVKASSVIGSAINVRMTITTAAVSGTLTADEIVVGTALGGQTYRLASFSQSINISTTGAGGMDVGTGPASGYVAIYAIYNPTTTTAALLGVNVTSIVAPTVCGGTMPSGYTTSALLAVWPTNASSQLLAGGWKDRAFTHLSAIQALSTNATAGSTTSLSIPGILPKSAQTVSGTIYVGTTAVSAGSGNFYFYPFPTSAAVWAASVGAVSNVFAHQTTFSGLPVTTVQTLYYQSAGPTTPLFQVYITGYTI